MSVTVALAMAGAAAGADPVSTDALNSLRAQHGRPPLAYSPTLEAAAMAHARDMAERRFFSHQGSDGSDVSQRVTRTGYGWCVVAENIAQGQFDLAEVMQAWAASPGHMQNMLRREVSEFALAEAPGFIWVMVLAAPGC